MKISFEVPISILTDECKMTRLYAAGLRYVAIPYQLLDMEDNIIIGVAETLKKLGIKADTTHLPFNVGYDPAHSPCTDDESARLETVAMWQHYLSRFPLLDIRVTPLHTGGCMQTFLPEYNREQLTKTLTAILPYAEKANTIIALENTFFVNPPACNGYTGGKIGEYDRLNDNCALLSHYCAQWHNPHLALCHDVGHSNLFGHNQYDDIRTMQPQVRLYHFHDNLGVKDNHIAPGLGNFDWFHFVKAIKTAEYDEPLFAEVLHTPLKGQNVNTFTTLLAHITGVSAFMAMIENYIDEAPVLYPVEKKVLCIGNSFSQDNTCYLEEMAQGRLFVRNCYIGGCSLERHAGNIGTDEKCYEYQHDAIKTGMVSLEEALQKEDWDVVTIQQNSPLSGVIESYEPYITSLLGLIAHLAPKAKVMLNQTWAYEINATHPAFQTYQCNQDVMYSAIEKANNSAANKHGLTQIKTGEAVQSARKLPAFDVQSGGIPITRDGYHLSYDYGRYLSALVWLKALLNTDVREVTFVPRGADEKLLNMLRNIANR